MIWYNVDEYKPLATGCWDGKKSEPILVCTRSHEYHVAVMYHVIMDGSETFNFYDERDYEIENVEYWAKINYPF